MWCLRAALDVAGLILGYGGLEQLRLDSEVRFAWFSSSSPVARCMLRSNGELIDCSFDCRPLPSDASTRSCSTDISQYGIYNVYVDDWRATGLQ